MADVKISALPNAAALTGAELVPLVQSGGNVKVTASVFGAFLGTGYVNVTTDQDVGGIKTFTARPVFNIGMRIPVSQQIRFGDGVAADLGAITANSAGTTIVAGGAAAGSGGLLLRPTSAASVVGQMVINADGTISVAGQATLTGGAVVPSAVSLILGGTSGAQIQGTTGHLILGQAGGASQIMFFRPKGIGSTANQTTMAYSGVWTFGAEPVFPSGARIQGDNQRLTFGDGTIVNASVRATTTNAMVVAAGPGTAGSTGQIILRPNGDNVSTEQITILGTGAMTFGISDAAKAATRTSLGAASVPGTWSALPTLQNGFADLGGAFNASGYRRIDNKIELRGVLTSASHSNSPLLFTLPVGFRPAARQIMFSGCSVPGSPFALARIDVETDGKVTMLQPLSTSTDFVVLDNLSFNL